MLRPERKGKVSNTRQARIQCSRKSSQQDKRPGRRKERSVIAWDKREQKVRVRRSSHGSDLVSQREEFGENFKPESNVI